MPPSTTVYELVEGCTLVIEIGRGTALEVRGDAAATLCGPMQWLDGTLIVPSVPLRSGGRHCVTQSGWVQLRVTRSGTLVLHTAQRGRFGLPWLSAHGWRGVLGARVAHAAPQR